MSQQVAAGQGTPATGCGGKAGQFFRHRGDPPIKRFKSAISKIANNRFNMGQNQFACPIYSVAKENGQLPTTYSIQQKISDCKDGKDRDAAGDGTSSAH